MKEQKINFETAKLAKEKGFDVHCKSFHSESIKKPLPYDITISEYKSGREQYRPYYLAPTQSLLQKWLREVHNIDCHAMGVRFTGDLEVGYYTYAVRSIQPVGRQKYKFDSWEEALEIGLQEALNLIE